LEKRNFEICGSIQDTLNENSLSYLERFEGASSWNFAQWVHPHYRELLTQAKKTSDPIEQQQLTQKAKVLFAQNVPFTHLFDYVHLFAHHPRFECSAMDEEGCIDFSQGRTLIK
jgi:ABC-type oligopeptide transport system substrate-binding subunit